MPWTDSRSRDEWLAEVRRRGTRIRRRRRAGFGVLGALALVLPVSVTATVLSGGAERAVELSVAGPAPADGMATLPATLNELATGEVPTVGAEVAPTTTVAEMHQRMATINGVPAPGSSPASAPPADDPVVGRSTATTNAPSGNIPVQGGALSLGAASASPGPGPAPCAADEFKLTVSMEKNAFARGEPVKGSSVLEKRSAGTCLLPSWSIEIRFLNGAGMDVSQNARSSRSSSTVDQHKAGEGHCGEGGCRPPVEPGPVFTHTFEWETIDCTNVPPVTPVPPDDSHCVAFPPGSYTVSSDWSGPGSGPPASATFEIGA